MPEATLEARVAKLEGRVDGFDGRFDRLERRLETIESMMSKQFYWLLGGQITVLVSVIGVLSAALFLR